MGDYNDIIHLPHHQSRKKSHMAMTDRAAQFSPFAALTGFEGAIAETGRLTDNRPELMEYGKAQLDQKLFQLLELLPDITPEVTISCFSPDERKAGGAREEVHGLIKKADMYRKILILTDGREIAMENILDIEGPLLCDDAIRWGVSDLSK